MKEILLDNFLRMVPQVPEYSEKNPNYLISGANPIYYLDEGGEEQQFSPMAASVDWKQVTTSIEGNIVQFVSSTDGTHDGYFITSTTHVYALGTSGLTDLGYPSGSLVNNLGGCLAVANGILFAAYAGAVYKMTIPGSFGGWTSVGSVAANSGGTNFMEPFLDFVALVTGPTSSKPYHYIDVINTTSFTITAPPTLGIDVGSGWGILKIANLNNKYLCIAAGQTATTSGTAGYDNNYIFIWDGISSRYNQSVKVPGKFLDMKVINSILYVGVQESSGKSSVYYLVNNSLRKMYSTQVSSIRATVYSPTPCSLFDFKGNIGVHLQTFQSIAGLNITDPLLIYGNEESGTTEFIHSSGRVFDQIFTSYSGIIYANTYVQGGNSLLFYLPTTNTTYQEIIYQSQAIPVKNVGSIDIIYDAPPQNVNDAISVTLVGYGEDIIAGSQTLSLDDITSTNYLNAKRTRLDVKGFVGDKVIVHLSTANSAWRPIIRGIKLNTE